MQNATKRAPRRKTLQTIFAAGLASAFLGVASTPASAANIFEALFGVRRAPVVAPQPMLPSASLPGTQQQTKKKRLRTARGDAPSQRAKSAARPPVLAGPLGQFLMDPTLRRGDVVVTSEGLKIFTGNGGGTHSPKDFAALTSANQYSAGKAPVLLAIDKANRSAAKPLVEVQAVPVPRATPEPTATAAKTPGKQASAARTVR
jgi:hypothetical protein